MPTPQPTPPPTAADLTEGSWRRRIAALARLPLGEPVPAELLPALVELLAAPDSAQREAAVAAVVRAGAPAVPLLVESLTNQPPEQADSRRAMVVALGRLGALAAPAVPLLGTLLDDPWLGPCVESALAAIAEERAGRNGWVHLVVAAALMVVCVSLGWVSSGSFDPLLAAAAVVGWSVAIGLLWTRPGPAAWVVLFAVGVTVALAATVVDGVSHFFADVAAVLIPR